MVFTMYNKKLRHRVIMVIEHTEQCKGIMNRGSYIERNHLQLIILMADIHFSDSTCPIP